ncbi:hypothetical protein IQ255_20260 [Pleurocapsales cyanobacterium LEGE 10410]|nr:hypothetical protein [Pleurocapsales cyanobacterium LEGE 10410]
MYEISKFFKETFLKPSNEQMFQFMSETDSKAKADTLDDGIPDDKDLSRLSHIFRYIWKNPNGYRSYHDFSRKYLCLYQNMGKDSGLVYCGSMSNNIPQGYGEVAYRYVGGAIYYAGYFDNGFPCGECRFSIRGSKSCYGSIQTFVRDNKVKHSFRST